MLRPVELTKLLMNTAEAISKVDFSNPNMRKSYMEIERTFTELKDLWFLTFQKLLLIMKK